MQAPSTEHMLVCLNTFFHMARVTDDGRPAPRPQSCPPCLRLATSRKRGGSRTGADGAFPASADGDLRPTSRRVGSSSGEAQEEPEGVGPVVVWMVKNLPSRVRPGEMMWTLDHMGFRGQYDYFYMPFQQGGGRRGNKGYAFVGFPDVSLGDRFCETIQGFQFPGRRSKKTLTVSPARMQDMDEIKDHFHGTAASCSQFSPVIRVVEAEQPRSTTEVFVL